MSDNSIIATGIAAETGVTETVASPAHRSRPTREDRPDITSNGRTYKPRWRVAKNAGVDERTLRRKHRKAIYVGGVAYVVENDAIADLIGEPQEQRQRRRTRRI